jgi:hypothetical protein
MWWLDTDPEVDSQIKVTAKRANVDDVLRIQRRGHEW